MTPSEFHDLVRRAEDGDVEAQYNLADMYHKGLYVPRNYAEAEKWYLRSVEQGREDARVLYLKGLAKRTEGMSLLELEGKQGNAWACYELAKALSQPGDHDGDPVTAYSWFCLAEAYELGDKLDKICKKEIEKLESELSIEQLLQ